MIIVVSTNILGESHKAISVISEIVCRFPVRLYVTVISPVNKRIELPIASLRVEDLVDFPLVGVTSSV
jgi:hypothetical protein